MSEKRTVLIMLRRQAQLPSARGLVRPLDREVIAGKHGMAPDERDQLLEFLKSHGLTVDAIDEVHCLVKVSGSVADLASAFRVPPVLYELAGQRYLGHSAPIHVPASLAPFIVGIAGFDDRPVNIPHFKVRDDAAPRALSMDAVKSVYRIPTKATGAGQTVAILEFGGGYSPSDLTTFLANEGLGAAPTVTPLGTGNPGVTGAEADFEVALDIQIVAAIAPGAAIQVFFAPNSFAGSVAGYAAASGGGASVISTSWGAPERTWPAGVQAMLATIMTTATTAGITICAATGDSGSSDGLDNGLANVDLPAVIPVVVACGGTQLNLSDGEFDSEVVWNDDGSTGGGISDFTTRPTWQAATGIPASINSGGFIGRGLPDVAGNADPGYNIVIGGSSHGVRGTSAVAPLYAAVFALINQNLATWGLTVGNFNSVLYTTPELQHVFYDVTNGDNGSFTAGTGWDACTGWGALRAALLLDEMTPPVVTASQIFAVEDECGIIAVSGSSARFSLAVGVDESPGEALPYKVTYAWSGVSGGDAPVIDSSHTFVYDIPASDAPPPVTVTVTVTVAFTGTTQVRIFFRTRTVQPITPSEKALICALKHYRAGINYSALGTWLRILGVIGIDPDRGGPHNLPSRVQNIVHPR